MFKTNSTPNKLYTYAKLRETKLYRLFRSGSYDEIFNRLMANSKSGKNQRSDIETGGTYLHLLADYIWRFVDKSGSRLIYVMACKATDLDKQDYKGDTFMHIAMRKPNTFRVIVALVRCGADTLIRNNEGKTPEEVLLETKPEGWEETLHWFNKFKPGLYRAMLDPKPDRNLIEKLLKYFCRPTVVKNEKTMCLKQLARENIRDIDLVYLIEKYENNIEFALALLTGKDLAVRKYFKNVENAMENIDINLKDYSYQYRYPDYPETPQPLLVACWESGSLENVNIMLEMGVDTSALFSYRPGEEEALPLFFQAAIGITRPSETIVQSILQASDMSVRDTNGRTLLYHVIEQNYPETFIKSLFKYGLNVASRDKYGRTARDFAKSLKKIEYCRMIDDQVLYIVRRCNIERVESLVLQGYEHLPNITDKQGKTIQEYAKERCSKQLMDSFDTFEAVQDHIHNVFCTVESGDLGQLRKSIGKKYATALNRCGRNVLHVAVMCGHRSMVTYLIETFPQLLNVQDNLGRTPLHYAKLFLEGEPIISTMTSLGADTQIRDVRGRTPLDFSSKVLGDRPFILLKKEVLEMTMEMFLKDTNFEETFTRSLEAGDLNRLQALVRGLKRHGDINRYSYVLFDCIENGWENQAVLLIKEGLNTNIFKQYEKCDPNSAECAMCECDHTVTSFKNRAIQLKRTKVMNLLKVVAPEKNGLHLTRSLTEVSEFGAI